MDIGSLTSAAASTSGVDLSSKVSTRVARITLDEQKREGDAAIKLLEGASDIAKSSASRDGRLDVQA